MTSEIHKVRNGGTHKYEENVHLLGDESTNPLQPEQLRC
jgi:hypothetical protein